jgi:hypothetical protein
VEPSTTPSSSLSIPVSRVTPDFEGAGGVEEFEAGEEEDAEVFWGLLGGEGGGEEEEGEEEAQGGEGERGRLAEKRGAEKRGRCFFGVRLWRLVGGGRGERGHLNIELQYECGGGGAFLE